MAESISIEAHIQACEEYMEECLRPLKMENDGLQEWRRRVMRTDTTSSFQICPACNTHHPNGWACPRHLRMLASENLSLRMAAFLFIEKIEDRLDDSPEHLDELCELFKKALQQEV